MCFPRIPFMMMKMSVCVCMFGTAVDMLACESVYMSVYVRVFVCK